MKIKEKIKYGLCTAIVTGTDIFWVQTYDGQYKDFIRGYGHDFLLPAIAYFSGRFVNFDGGKKDKLINITLTALCTFEFTQYLGWYPGDFSPYDFLAYSLGIGVAFSTDLLINKKKNRGLEKIIS